MCSTSRWARVAAIGVLAVVAACGRPVADRNTGSANALSISPDTAAYYGKRVMESLGGQEAWDRTRYVSFHWKVERDGQVVADREHSWDRYDGRYRLAFEQRDTTHLMLFNIHELRPDSLLGEVPSGRAWIGDRELEGATRDSALRGGYSMFINDTYWALMPFKWADPGVHLSYEGMKTLSDGRDYATIHLDFDPGLGVTEDQYWAFVDPDDGHMAAWQFHLGRSEKPGDIIWWRDWTDVGTVRFALNRVTDDGERFIYLEEPVASETVPPGRFEPPTP